jgi:hypothetical protein
MAPRTGHTGRQRALLTLCLVLAAVPLAAAARAPQIRIIAPPDDGRAVELKPQSSRTFVFHALNRSGAAVTCEPAIVLPPGWRLLVPETAFDLAPGEDSTRLVAVLVPGGAAAGSYKIIYRWTVRGSAVAEETALPVRVPAETELALKAGACPGYIVAGDSYRALFEISNRGNSAADIAVAVQSPDGFAAVPEWNSARLESGRSRTLAVTVKTDASLRGLVIHRLMVTAAATAPDAAPARETVATEVKIVPRVSGVADYYRRLPLEFSTVGLYNPMTRTSGQFRLEGTGALDAAGRQTVDFLFRGPGLADMLSFGLQREEYRLSFDSPGASIRLGDHVFSLSKLTESGRYGRGAGAEIRPFPFLGLQAYYAESPREWLVEKRRQKAARLTLRPSDNLQFGANFVGTKVDEAPESRALSLQGQWTTKPLSLNAEYAFGSPSDRSGDRSGRALWVDAAGRAGRAAFQATYVDADASFPGYYKNILYRSAQASWQPFGPLGLRASYQDQQLRTPSALFVSTLAENSALVGAQADISSKIRIGLDYRRVDRKDLSSAGMFNYRDETIRLGVFSFFGTLAARAAVDLGRTRNFLTGRVAGLREFDASLSFEPLRGLSFGGSADYRDQDRGFTGEMLKSLDLRLDASLKWGGTRLDAYYRTSFRRNFFLQLTEAASLDDPFLMAHRLDMLEASLSHRFANGHSAAIRLRGVSPLDGSPSGAGALSRVMVSFEYTIPLRMPVGRRSDIGKISGRVLDAETPGRGLANVLVKANDLAVFTDDRGSFVFHGVKPDTYYLSLEPASVRGGQVPLQDGPLSVSIEGPAEKTVDIPLARAGAIAGRVALIAAEEKDAPAADAAAAGLAGTIVEARQGTAVFSQITDDKGRFRFEDLRPGRWALVIDSEDLPEFTAPEKTAVEIDVRPGLTADSTIRVLQRHRAIQFIDGGEIAVDQGRKNEVVAPSAPSAAAAKGPVLLQAGVFSTLDNAERMRRSMADLSPAVKIEAFKAAGKTFYRVLISCPDGVAAETLKRASRERGVDVISVKAGRRK